MAAYLTRFEGALPPSFFHQLLVLVPLLAVARVGANYIFGVYRIMWRYVGLPEALRFVQSIGSVSVILVLIRLLLIEHSQYFVIPIGVIVIEGTLTFIAMTGARFLPRILAERYSNEKADRAEATLLVGAGRGGLAIAKEALRHPDLGIRPVGFVDDDQSKRGMEIQGLRVMGTLADVERVVRTTAATRLIITTESIPSKAILDLMDRCRPLNVNVRIVPRLFELLGSQNAAEQLREVQIEDLLSRDPIPPSLSMTDLKQIYGGKTVLVTGAGGSIGSELCRQLQLTEPERLLLVERDETNLFEINRELARNELADRCLPILLDITHTRDLEAVLQQYKPDVIFHAAAFKHVPMMERFPFEAVRNNIFGTHKLAQLAIEHGVESFVMISTDKAVNPTSVMGASKRFAEQIVQYLAPKGPTKFSCVRFGNVLGSRGSVVGIFREQIQRRQPLTVTHPEATRYFMTIPEASNLVIQAATLGDNGEIFLLDMGEPVKIVDLARQMIHLSGATEKEIPIRIVGTRPGEKLFEELRTDIETISKTPLRKVFRCEPEPVDGKMVETILERLSFPVRARDAEGVRACIRDLQIGYEQPPTEADRDQSA